MNIKIIISVFLFTTLFYANSFNKVMSKNRANKNINGSNYKIINSKEEYKKVQKHGNTIGIKIENKRIGKVYNYVEISNVKLKKEKDKRKYGLSKIKPSNKKKKLYGVKINDDFNGKVLNTVKIKNSRLN